VQRLGQILELGRVEPTGTIAVFRATAVDVVYHDLPLHSRADDLAGRFGTAIERSLYRALHELQRVQAARQDGITPPSIAVDVTVDGPGPAPNSDD
jgi:hypothetical protein